MCLKASAAQRPLPCDQDLIRAWRLAFQESAFDGVPLRSVGYKSPLCGIQA
jgi:hypothetical protein